MKTIIHFVLWRRRHQLFLHSVKAMAGEFRHVLVVEIHVELKYGSDVNVAY